MQLWRGRLRLSHRIANAARSERIAFQPAIEMPSTDRPIAPRRSGPSAAPRSLRAGPRPSRRSRPGALGEALPEVELDAGMVDADPPLTAIASAASQTKERPRSGMPAGEQGGEREGERRHMRVTLPPAHLAGHQPAPILKAIGAAEQGAPARARPAPWRGRADWPSPGPSAARARPRRRAGDPRRRGRAGPASGSRNRADSR